jgi:hypothetical protein
MDQNTPHTTEQKTLASVMFTDVVSFSTFIPTSPHTVEPFSTQWVTA